MRAQSMLLAGALLAAGWLAVGPAPAEETKPAPVKTPLEVTYYYLPG